MKKKRYSIKDIASKLGVSSTTVSFVLNGKAQEKRISEKLTKKILDYIEEINFKPNQVAQSLRTGKSKIIVFMVEDISNSFFAQIARIIEDLAFDKGYKILFCSNDNEDKKSNELIDLFIERQVDGFILIPSSGIKDTVKKLLEFKIPVVLFDRYFPDLDSNYVIIDNEYAAYDATQHLIHNNFKNISFITTDVEQTQMLDRLKGYKKAIKENGLTDNIFMMPFKERQSDIKKNLLKTYLSSNEKLDAIFFSTNYLARTGLLVIKENFPHLVNKLGILTFDDNDFFVIYTPSISAISQPLFPIAEQLMLIILNSITKGNKNSIQKVVLKCKLQIRDSSLDKARSVEKKIFVEEKIFNIK